MKTLSKRRAAEFRGRRLKRIFGDRRKRAIRFARLADLYGREMAIMMSRGEFMHWRRPITGCSCPECAV